MRSLTYVRDDKLSVRDDRLSVRDDKLSVRDGRQDDTPHSSLLTPHPSLLTNNNPRSHINQIKQPNNIRIAHANTAM